MVGTVVVKMNEKIREMWQDVYDRLEADDLAVADDVVDGEGRAEDHLRALTYHRQRIAQIHAHAKEEIEKITLWEERQCATIERRCTYHRSSLATWIKAIGAKTANLVHGTVRVVKGRRSVAILNEQAIPKDYLRETISYAPDKKAIMAAMDDGGEVVDGTEIVDGEDTVTIKTMEDA